jgi:hypothetical protein
MVGEGSLMTSRQGRQVPVATGITINALIVMALSAALRVGQPQTDQAKKGTCVRSVSTSSGPRSADGTRPLVTKAELSPCLCHSSTTTQWNWAATAPASPARITLMAPLLVPWDRQPGEGSKAFAAFCVYRDMGEKRTFVSVAEKFGKSDTLMRRWAGQRSWVTRSAAWDNEQDRIKRRAFARESVRLGERQARLGQLMQARSAKRISDMTEKDIEALTIFEATRLGETGARIERMARGENVIAPAEVVSEVRQLNIVTLLGQDPSRIGPVVDLLGKLSDLLPELASGEPINVTPPEGRG